MKKSKKDTQKNLFRLSHQCNFCIIYCAQICYVSATLYKNYIIESNKNWLSKDCLK